MAVAQTTLPLSLILQFVTALLVGVILYYLKRALDEWATRGERGEKLERIVTGEGHRDGLVDLVEDHEVRLDQHEDRLDETQQRVDALCEKNRWRTEGDSDGESDEGD